MFGNKKSSRNFKIIVEDNWIMSQVFDEISLINDKLDRLQLLEDFLNIEYKEETTKGYVKKETGCPICGRGICAGCPIIDSGIDLREMSGRKSNNWSKI